MVFLGESGLNNGRAIKREWSLSGGWEIDKI